MDSRDNMYVTFKLDEEYCAFPIENVISIEKIQARTRVPNSPNFLEGVINLRGDVIALINLRKKLGIPEIPLDKDTRVIIVNCGDIAAGIIVDASSEVMEIDDSKIDDAQLTEENKNHNYIKGIGKTDTGIITILKVEEIFKN